MERNNILRYKLGNQNPSIVYVLPGDIILGRSSAITAGGQEVEVHDPYTVWAISLQEGQEGRLWEERFRSPIRQHVRTLGPLDPVNRV